MSDAYIRLLLRKGTELFDMSEDIDVAEWGGTAPQVGDRFVQLLKGGAEGYRVVDRVFDQGLEPRYINLILEAEPIDDLRGLARFSGR